MAVTCNLLVTGPPRSGKTTVVQRVRERLEPRDYVVGGVVCPELRADGVRVGFEIVDLLTGDRRIMAHVDLAAGPRVGKYRVDVAAVDAVCSAAFPKALEGADVLLGDEIAPMELHSEQFVAQVRRALDADLPLVAAVHYRPTEGFVGEVEAREDAETFEVIEATRDDLPARLTERLLACL